MKILFLDVDGVLNDGSTWFRGTRTPHGFTGIDDRYVDILAKVVNKYDLKIVLSSDWRCYAKDEDYQYLLDKLGKFGLSIYSETPSIDWSERGDEIIAWLDAHEGVEDYVILDDNFFNFPDLERTAHNTIITDGIAKANPMFTTDDQLVNDVCLFIRTVAEEEEN